MLWYRWLAASGILLLVFWFASTFIAFALWKKYLKEPWEDEEDEKREWKRFLKLGPLGLLQVIGIATIGALFLIWLLANEVVTGSLRLQQPLRWLLMPIALPIDIVGRAIYLAVSWVTYALDDLRITSLGRRLPRPTI